MFLRADGIIDKQLKRMSSGCRADSWCSVSTAESSSAVPSDAMIRALIRDLSFWDAIPPVTAAKVFPSPLPQRPTAVQQQAQRQQQYEQAQPRLKRGRNARESSSSSQQQYYQQQQQQQRGEYDHHHHHEQEGRRGSKSSSSSKGTINDHNNNSSWRPQPVWKAALDPMTGRTYWYDAVTRQTQWEKPAEVRQMEKQKKAQKRKRDRQFFQEMERNIIKSLSRGEVVPGIPTTKLEPTGPPLEPRNSTNPRNFRTLSRMDDTILAELRDDVVSPEEFDRAMHQAAKRTQSSSSSRPRSNSRGRPPLPGPSRSGTMDRSRSRSRSQQQGEYGAEAATEVSNHEQHGKVHFAKNPPLPRGGGGSSGGLSMSSLSSSSSTSGRSSSNNKPSSHQPQRQEQTTSDDPAGPDAALAGEHLLDGPIQPEVQSLAVEKPAKYHIRRNTGGTIYVNGTMSNPDVEATIKCVCGVYRAHLVQAAEERNKNSPVSVMNSDLEIFGDRYHMSSTNNNRHRHNNNNKESIPSLADIVEFYQEFYRRSQMEFDTIIMSLIYVERLIKTTHLTPGPENWRSVLFSCMVLASKVWDDLSMWNIDFSNVASSAQQQSSSSTHSQSAQGGLSLFTLQRVNQLELVLLKSLNFDVRVPASEYAKYYFLIRTMLMRSGLLEVVAKPMSKEEAKVLENRTSQYQDSKLGMGRGAEGRRSQSMNDYSWLEKSSSSYYGGEQQQEGGELSRSPTGGPVLKDKVCLEQLVNF